jgi:hypothetical protein
VTVPSISIYTDTAMPESMTPNETPEAQLCSEELIDFLKARLFAAFKEAHEMLERVDDRPSDFDEEHAEGAIDELHDLVLKHRALIAEVEK